MRLADLRRVNERAIRDAGPRYMPGQDPDAPNLQITSIVETFDAFGITEAFRARIEDLRSRARTAWSDTPTDFRGAISRLANSFNRLAANLRSLSTASPAASGAAADTVSQALGRANRHADQETPEPDARRRSRGGRG